jgi:Protein of unknown function (DUF2550)
MVLRTVAIGGGILVLLLLALFVRRRIMMRGGGTIKLQVRVTTVVPGRGWSPGLGQFVGDELRFHRMFSFAVRPKRVLSRRGLAVESRRQPVGPERLSLPADWIILRCTSFQAPIEIAMAESTVTGFRSWLESAAPGPPTTAGRRNGWQRAS